MRRTADCIACPDWFDMNIENPDLSLPDPFDGIVRVFPLPTLVLLPGVIQGMHLTDPIHQRMVADTIAAGGLIATGLIAAPWSPALTTPLTETRDVVCLCRILSHSRLADGTETCLLCGVRRATIVRDMPGDTPYRLVQVDVWDEATSLDADRERHWRKQLLQQFETLAQTNGLLEHETLQKILVEQIPFGLLLDLIGSALELKAELTQTLLETAELENRAEILMEYMVAKTAGIDDNSNFPPDFSSN